MRSGIPFPYNADIPPAEMQRRVRETAAAMSPLPTSNGLPVFPDELVIDMGRAFREIAPAYQRGEMLSMSDGALGNFTIDGLLRAGVEPAAVWLAYNVWRVMRGDSPL